MDDPTKAIKKARALADDMERARALTELLGEHGLPALMMRLQQERQAVVQKMHADGITYAHIAEKIGLHRGRVAQIAKGVSGGKARRPAHLPDVEAKG